MLKKNPRRNSEVLFGRWCTDRAEQQVRYDVTSKFHSDLRGKGFDVHLTIDQLS